jgi:hypothetical protein
MGLDSVDASRLETLMLPWRDRVVDLEVWSSARRPTRARTRARQRERRGATRQEETYFEQIASLDVVLEEEGNAWHRQRRQTRKLGRK